ncbi:unnamed protein product, partial [Tenebrio molitor]
VIFDCKLSFTSHIDHLVSDSMKQLGFLIRNSRDFQSNRTLTMLFNAFVRSKLHYACIIWQPHYNIQAAKLEQIIRKFLKYRYLRDVGEYPPIGIAQTYLLNRFDCVSFAISCKKALAIFAFKLLHNILYCSEILSQLAFNAGSRGTKSRHYRVFYLPAHRTDMQPVIFKYTINTVMLDRPDIVCDLSVSFNGKLSFVHHQRPAKNEFTKSKTLLTLFLTFIRSKLDYAMIIWFPYQAVHIATIERVQRRFLK